MNAGSPERSSSLIGRTLAGFRILRLLGRGGMGEVYLAHEESLGRQVVLKFLAARWSGDAGLVQRFAREVRAAARLNHPNIVIVHAFHEVEGLSFYVMEYIEGRSLSQMIAAGAPLDVATALTITAQAAEGLACAHRQGILHRDIKPSNILVTPSGLVKVLDFGIAKILDEKSDLTTDGMFLGTLPYASPEQCEAGSLDARSDIYSLGAVLYEMLAGRPPHIGDTPLTLMRQIVQEAVPDLAQFNPHVPPAVRQLLGRLLAKQPALRIPNCETVASECRRILAEIGRGSAPGVMPTEKATTPLPQASQPQTPAAASATVANKSSRFWKKPWVWAIGVVILLAIFNRDSNRQRRPAEQSSVSPTPAVAAPTAAVTPTPTVASPTPAPPTPAAAWSTATPTAFPPAAAPTPPPVVYSLAAALQPVPADRDLVLGFHVRSLLNSQLMRSNESKVFTREATNNLDAFFGFYGVDWRRDIDHLVISGNTRRPETVCITFFGRWSEPLIVERLRLQKGFATSGLPTRPIYSVEPVAANQMTSVAFLASGVAVCGQQPALYQVCNAAMGQNSLWAGNLVRNAAVLLADQPDFWALGVRQPGPANPALANLDAWVLKARLTPDLELTGTAWPHDPAQIEGAYNLLNLVVQAWRNNKENPELRNLGNNVAVERSASTLTVRVRVLYPDLVRLLDMAAAQGNYPFR
ncbi:MAG: serine/threonine protein kinase [Candidatus Sumerlaeia bacterium]|nr:serine/threonine protein kinase [Candidatus Sumerlaeia bacterium]